MRPVVASNGQGRLGCGLVALLLVALAIAAPQAACRALAGVVQLSGELSARAVCRQALAAFR
jgi:hypothetical protein